MYALVPAQPMWRTAAYLTCGPATFIQPAVASCSHPGNAPIRMATGGAEEFRSVGLFGAGRPLR